MCSIRSHYHWRENRAIDVRSSASRRNRRRRCQPRCRAGGTDSQAGRLPLQPTHAAAMQRRPVIRAIEHVSSPLQQSILAILFSSPGIWTRRTRVSQRNAIRCRSSRASARDTLRANRPKRSRRDIAVGHHTLVSRYGRNASHSIARTGSISCRDSIIRRSRRRTPGRSHRCSTSSGIR